MTLGAAGAASREDVRSPGGAMAPVIEDNVTIHPGATIFGPVTVGRGAVIGGGLWLTENAAPRTRVVQGSPRCIDT